MNIQSKTNKILMALKLKGRIIKIDTGQWYSEEQERVITKYIVYEEHPKKDGQTFYSKIKILLYLVELYKKEGGMSG